MTQLFALYEYGAEEDRMWMKFEANMRGINIDKIEKETYEQSTSHLLFGDPKDYEKLSPEERELRTKEMLRYHKGWTGKVLKKGD